MSQPAQNVLERLNAVQALDLELDRLQQQEASIPEDLRLARDEKVRLEAALVAARESHMAVRRAVNEADLELRDLSAKRERARNDQRQSSSAKEQTQYENMIQQLSGRIEELENDSLPLVERMETLEASVKALEEQLEALAPRLAELEGMDEDRINALRADYTSKLQHRDSMTHGMDARLLREYDSVRKAKKGLGIVPVVAGKCGGCKMQLPLNIVQRVRGGTIPVKCPSCGRILWTGE